MGLIVLLLLSLIIRSLYLLYGQPPSSQFLAPNSPPAHATGSPTTSISATNRVSRAKAVAPLFSTASIRNSQETLLGVVDDFVDRLRQGAQSGRPVNVLGLARAMAIDAVSAYLFQERYGTLDENAEVMSAAPFVDAYVGVGAFFNFAYGRVGEFLVGLVGYLT
ncbi:hypothetical protein BDW60DRAFT_209078 [Aspergillus nidulans var. acristatus]